MNVYYTCRHCGVDMGKLPIDTVILKQLGFEQLTNQEMQEMIVTDSYGDMHVSIVCNHCEAALESNPSLHAVDYIIH